LKYQKLPEHTSSFHRCECLPPKNQNQIIICTKANDLNSHEKAGLTIYISCIQVLTVTGYECSADSFKRKRHPKGFFFHINYNQKNLINNWYCTLVLPVKSTSGMFLFVLTWSVQQTSCKFSSTNAYEGLQTKQLARQNSYL